MYGSTVYVSQFIDISPYVVTIRIETMGLPNRVESPVRLRVVARTGHPLPVAVIVRYVSVEQPVEEPVPAVPPVQAKMFGEERGDQKARPVVHPAFGRQLAHARVNDRHAGTPLPPCRHRGRIGAPALLDGSHGPHT